MIRLDFVAEFGRSRKEERLGTGRPFFWDIASVDGIFLVREIQAIMHDFPTPSSFFGLGCWLSASCARFDNDCYLVLRPTMEIDLSRHSSITVNDVGFL